MATQNGRAVRSLVNCEPVVYWLDRDDRPAARPRLDHSTTADLAVVGGGFSGLWTAVLAKERDPDRDVLLIEADRIGCAASGRNGGFCSPSLTHGAANGARHLPGELELLERLGRENLTEIEDSVRRYNIDCDFHRRGKIAVATQKYQVGQISNLPGFLERDAVRAEVNSPTYLAGLHEEDSIALLDPAALAFGLADAAERLGVRIVEQTPVRRVRSVDRGVMLSTEDGAAVTATQVALGTNVFPSLVRRMRLHTVPVYDYVLMTEPLTPEQMSSIGWANRQGLDDMANQFHYYRLTADNRILWGGYDAIYHYGRQIKPAYDQRRETFIKLATHFFATFPQLDGIRFTHSWGGAIDTCTRFFAFFGTALGKKVAYALGYTGLGVGATRFGANVMLDLLDGLESERTALSLVRRRPLPFPPEPAAYLGIHATRAALAAADRNDGRRNLWLRSLDRLGLGFDS